MIGTARATPVLNEAQRAAVERWGQDVCVVAGPGSGKTRVLIERFRWLVEAKGIPPGRILAVTFTVKAATEIKKRLIEACGESDPLREEIERAWVSTIHGFCTRLLKENAIAAGVHPDFRLLDASQSLILERRCANRALDELLQQKKDGMREILREVNLAAADLSEALLSVYEEGRSAGVTVDELRIPELQTSEAWAEIVSAAKAMLAEPGSGSLSQREAQVRAHRWAHKILELRESADWKERVLLLDELPRHNSLKSGNRARSLCQDLTEKHIPAAKAHFILAAHHHAYPLLLEALRGIHHRYSSEKHASGFLDFEDLQECTIRLLESNAALRQKVRESFDQVLMDELQDTNRLQWRLINLVRRTDSLFAVGDMNQSIYFFRHADPSVFRDYRDSLHARGFVVDELRENYRSRAEVIEAVNGIAPFLVAGVEPHRLTPQREYPAKLDPCVEFMHAYAERENEDAGLTEARWIARRIREMEGQMMIGKPGEQRPARFADMAILARTIGSLDAIQQALDDFGIPSSVSGGRSFYEAREIRDLMAWLAVLANPRDEVSLATVLRSPLAGVSDETILRLKLAGDDLMPSIIANEDEVRLKWFRSTIQTQRQNADVTPPDALLANVLDESSYCDGLTPRAAANVNKFLNVLRQRWKTNPATLGEWVDDLKRWRETGSEAEASVEEVINSVRLMSVHAAKGLEFPIVFLASMRSGPQNREPVFCFDERKMLGVHWRHPKIGGVSDPVHLDVCARKKRQEAGEEDRLLYVAMTRAEEHIVFTASRGGRSSWAKQVAEGLQVASEVPKRELHEMTAKCLVVHTHIAPPNVFAATATSQAAEVVQVDKPAVSDQHESVTPVTSVAQHAFCPRQYFLARFIGLEAAARVSEEQEEPEDKGEWTASEFGVAVHEILAGKARPDAPAEAQSLAQEFEKSWLGQRVARATRVGREFDFLIDMEGIILRGQIDLWFEADGMLVLVDYKSDQVETGEERRHAYRYGPQLRLYAMALERLTGRLPDKALIWYLRTGTSVDVSLAPSVLEEVRGQVKQLKQAQADVVFPLREGPHCLRCGFYHAQCPSQFINVEEEPTSTT